MADRASSNTAVGVAWLRAAHQILDDAPRILDDPAIVALLGPDTEIAVQRAAAEYGQPGARALRAHVVVRTRYAEERLEAAVRRGVRQYVVLGAGLDTFAYRQPAWASLLEVFEVDQPGTQRAKLERLRTSGIVPPPNVKFVAIDFEHEPLGDGLSRGGVRGDTPTFFSWLGVTMYLTREAIEAVFRTVVGFPRGSEIVFTFATPIDAADPQERGRALLAARAAEAGEPWITFYEPMHLAAELRRLGYSDVRLLSPAETSARYFEGRRDGLPAPRHLSIAVATV
jgi:methyltransferase (TIGR00027 family)